MERKLLSSGLGFQLKYSTLGVDERCRLPGLTFADDLVLMAESAQDLQDLIHISQAEITRLGLRFNCKKSAVVPLAGTCTDEVTLRLGDDVLMVCTTYRYLGVQLSSGPELFGQQEEILRQKALRAQSILRRQCLWGCNRLVMVRDLWKIVHVPALTFANAVLCLSAVTRDWLERRQREVGRIALGCHGAVANEAIQGDLGWSSFEAREAVSKIAYRGRLLCMPRERWTRRVFDYLSATCMRTPWVRRLYRIESKFGLFRAPLSANSSAEWAKKARERVREEEEARWIRNMSEKSTLAVYRCHKSSIGMVHLYDNSLGSKLLFEARAGALRTLVRLKAINKDVSDVRCRVCGVQDETIEHVVLQCEGIGPAMTDGASLETALGFEQAGGDDGRRSVDRAAVAATKGRLECWRAAVAARHS